MRAPEHPSGQHQTIRSGPLIWIWAPPFTTKSAGIRSLYTLRDELEERGLEARVHLIGSPCPEGVHIVPEGERGPLSGRVVRWLLSRSRPYPAGEDVTWHREFFPECPLLRVDLIEPEWFYPAEGRRTLDLVCGGKDGHMPRQYMPGAEITKAWPATRAELGDVLRAARVLYQYDSLSHVTIEAVLCGCPVMLMYGDAPEFWDAVPGVFRRLERLEEAQEAVGWAPEWYEGHKAQTNASIDRFASALLSGGRGG